jgi:hypothetical protein
LSEVCEVGLHRFSLKKCFQFSMNRITTHTHSSIPLTTPTYHFFYRYSSGEVLLSLHRMGNRTPSNGGRRSERGAGTGTASGWHSRIQGLMLMLLISWPLLITWIRDLTHSFVIQSPLVRL